MKLLLDTCVWGGAASVLRDRGHDVVWMGDSEPDPGDDAIMAIAFREARVIVTLDKDFGELAIVYRRPHRGILRLVGLSARQQGPYCAQVVDRYAADLESGAILTVTAQRVRIRAPD
ncbi:toxin-antitoxin system, toxin component, PIN family protein [Lamprobacter modestohalophilus]|uniref:Toxin-antitoxin system, toxin component, PIN family protein n=1 Tax=Lamprobacter modestohalophilus TaxID=1064514 RepID=A0A9X0WCA7_9GAMM|nr:toxin-antitoxin system, toxin component, PIN family protein [Lamprobacter modestohalophilus]